MSTINQDNAEPMYMQLKELLSNQITQGYYSDGDKLPSERELCETYKVSRITVRQALSELENAGMVIRSHGKGTYVKHVKLEQELCVITPFQNSLIRQGVNPKTELISFSEIPNTFQLSKLLDAPLVENIYELKLLGYGNDEPMAYYTSYFKSNMGKLMNQLTRDAIEQGLSFTTLDLYKKITEPEVGSVYQTFEASIADTYIAKVLSIKKGSPILIVESTVYSTNEIAVEIRTAVYRGDKYKFSIVRKI